MRTTKRWQGRAEGRRLGAMAGTISSGGRSEKNGWLRVLGVDPAATGPTGYGIVESDGRRCRMLHYGTLKVAAKRQKECVGAALQDVHARVCGLLEQFSPDALAVESVFIALNMLTALRLAEVRGVILLATAQHGVLVYSYAPREVKARVAGHGHAGKRQMQLMVRALLSMNETPEPSDAADALAVALCHVQTEQARRRFGLRDEDLSLNLRKLRTAAGSTGLPNEILPGGTTRGALPRIVSTR